MKITRSTLGFVLVLLVVGTVAAQSNDPIDPLAESPLKRIGTMPTSVGNSTEVDTRFFQTGYFDNKIRQDVQADRPILDEAAISEQLKQLHAEIQALKASSHAATQAEAISDLHEEITRQGDQLNFIDKSLDSFVMRGHHGQTMRLFGRLHYDYWAFPRIEDRLVPLAGDPQDRFMFRRMRLGVQGDIRDNMFYRLELELVDQLERRGFMPISYRDAFIGFRDLPLFNTLIIGNQKRPYGLDTWTDSNQSIFMERSFATEAFNPYYRRLGISSMGYSDDLRQNWQYGLYNYQLTQFDGGHFGDHYQPEFAGRFAMTPWYDDCSGGRGYAHVAVVGSVAFPDGRGANNGANYFSRPEAQTDNFWFNTGQIANANRVDLAGFEAVFNAGPFQIGGEYQVVRVLRNGTPNNVNMHGGYVYASYFLTGEHIPWDRRMGRLGRVQPFENFWRVRDCNCMTQSGLGAWQVAARLSHGDLIDEDIFGGEGTALTLGLNWYWNPYARMQFNYIFGNIISNPQVAGDYQALGVRFMVDF
ncbi:MAG TPA: porin [Pirellulaceae bacterium]|nr:porin [Pirellulaceae bacterium]HMO90963.1 porin [Pirellulaceae bacterium]